MSIAYQNVDFSNYAVEPPTNTFGQEYTFTFSSNSPAINPIDPDQYTLGSYLTSVSNGNVPGFSFINLDDNIVYGNKTAILLPTEIGGSIEGVLDNITGDFRNIGNIVPGGGTELK